MGANAITSCQPEKPKSALSTSFSRAKIPHAVAMWDFSWLERRWPGAGYEDWDQALDELAERGYNAVRIDAYPHLVAENPEKEWLLDPEWGMHDWGSPAPVKVSVQPNLNTFIKKCKDRNIIVYLSTWWRNDSEKSIAKIKSPEDLAEVWIKALKTIDRDLHENIYMVDLCNEYPHAEWPKFLPPNHVETYSHEDYETWMRASIPLVKKEFPDFNYTFSFFGDEWVKPGDKLDYLDIIEIHVWMENFSDFTERINYQWKPFDFNDYYNMQKAETTYRSDEGYWKSKVQEGIDFAVQLSEQTGLPLITTESWGSITYKDWPGLDWGWQKEICAFGVEQAAKTGRWISMCTSNFCGPQFKGMWRDIAWHNELTAKIKSAQILSDLYK
ncbi:MAG: cellulase [Cyclobacteriaceae bacterium]|nr:cellulase [Cyclobacteriaceae bacterium]